MADRLPPVADSSGGAGRLALPPAQCAPTSGSVDGLAACLAGSKGASTSGRGICCSAQGAGNGRAAEAGRQSDTRQLPARENTRFIAAKIVGSIAFRCTHRRRKARFCPTLCVASRLVAQQRQSHRATPPRSGKGSPDCLGRSRSRVRTAQVLPVDSEFRRWNRRQCVEFARSFRLSFAH